jgi:hypothetical protein
MLTSRGDVVLALFPNSNLVAHLACANALAEALTKVMNASEGRLRFTGSIWTAQRIWR